MPQQLVPVFTFRLYQVVTDPSTYDLGDDEKSRLVASTEKVPRPTELTAPARAPLITAGQLVDLLNELQERGACGPTHYPAPDPNGPVIGQLVLVSELVKYAALDLGADILLPGPRVRPS